MLNMPTGTIRTRPYRFGIQIAYCTAVVLVVLYAAHLLLRMIRNFNKSNRLSAPILRPLHCCTVGLHQ